MGKLAQALEYGAVTFQVEANFDGILRLILQIADQVGLYLLNSVNPFRLEGQKLIMVELLEQCGWKEPDWIVLPGGNLGNVSAFGKGLRELLDLGFDSQAAAAGGGAGRRGCPAVSHAFGRRGATPAAGAPTVAGHRHPDRRAGLLAQGRPRITGIGRGLRKSSASRRSPMPRRPSAAPGSAASPPRPPAWPASRN